MITCKNAIFILIHDFAGFFSCLDGQVGAVTLKTHLYNVARYVGQVSNTLKLKYMTVVINDYIYNHSVILQVAI